jgi:hypothetical protein
VAGPPVPPERFSLLPIRGAYSAMADRPDESNLKVSCNMAQAFEIPQETRQRPDDGLQPEPS